MAVLERTQHRVGQLAERGAVEADAQLRTAARSQGAGRLGKRVGIAEQRAHPVEQGFSFPGQGDVPRVPLEELNAEFPFKRGDGAGERGLGEIEAAGGDAVIQFFRQNEEVS